MKKWIVLQLGQIDESECRVEGQRAANVIFPVSPSFFVRPEKGLPWGRGDSELVPDRLSLFVEKSDVSEELPAGY